MTESVQLNPTEFCHVTDFFGSSKLTAIAKLSILNITLVFICCPHYGLQGRDNGLQNIDHCFHFRTQGPVDMTVSHSTCFLFVVFSCPTQHTHASTPSEYGWIWDSLFQEVKILKPFFGYTSFWNERASVRLTSDQVRKKQKVF